MIRACGESARTTVKNVFMNTPEGKRSVGKPRKRWFDDAESNLAKMGVSGWRKTDKDRDAWELILKEARVLHKPNSQSRDKDFMKTTILALHYNEVKHYKVSSVSDKESRHLKTATHPPPPAKIKMS
jgi:hypothetical protein